LFVFCALAAFEALAPVTGAFQHLGQVIASAKRITQITEQEPEVAFPQGKGQTLDRVSLRLHQVTFSYPQQPSPALEKVSLQIEAGEHIAILGRTGCGKSTLLQLLTRAWDPAEGEILLNNQPLGQFNEATLRRAMSVVPQ
ncbi:ATP-binding cassette domain-containing protein, partial [Escherichia coli]|uniref:ATP-binding cassette domain-containing protein n=2 Tax=Enterobacteriaceae TaxID=543 RepID=UPI0013656DD1